MWYLKNNCNWPYVIKKNALTEEEIELIIKHGQKNLNSVGFIGGGELNPEVRKSKIAWLNPNSEIESIYKKLTDTILEINDNYFRYNIDWFEDLQYTEYDECNKGKYSAHNDSGYTNAHEYRKLSFSIQLSNAEDYKGGKLLMYTDNLEPKEAPTEKGTLILFPSYMIHEVTPVKKGNRKSLVCWVHGPAFK
jgi:PKHD-type hydroxylase